MKLTKASEATLQESCIKWFRLQYRQFYLCLFAIPNGEKREQKEYTDRSGNVKRYSPTAKRLKNQGVVSGVADLYLAIPNSQYPGMFIEMKFGKNKQSDNQKDFEKAVTALGYKYVLIYDFDSFKCEIDNYISNRINSKAS